MKFKKINKKVCFGIVSLCISFIAFNIYNAFANNVIIKSNSLHPINMVGKYSLSTTGSSNVYGAYLRAYEGGVNIWGNQETSTPVRFPSDGGNRYLGQSPDGRLYGGSGNSSGASITKPTANANIVKAYLIEESSVYGYDDARVLADKPMRLVAPNGASTYSNPMNNTVYTTYYRGENTTQVGESIAVTVSDVTDFVKNNGGYGYYQGWDIPYYSRQKAYMDQIGGWKLVIISEDENTPIRMLRMKYGCQSTSHLTEGEAIQTVIDGAGIKTKSVDNVTGQILIGGTGGDTDESGSVFKFQPSPNTGFFNLGTYDRSNGKYGNRMNNFFEGVVTINGSQTTNSAITGYRMSDNYPVNNNDLVLMDINGSSSNLGANGHNAYLVNNSPSVTVRASTEATFGQITLLGLTADIDVAKYESNIIHQGQAWQDNKLSMSAHVENTTNIGKDIGVSGGYAVIQVDSNIRLDPNNVKATYKDKTDGRTYSLNSGDMMSISGNTITVAFGKDNSRISQVGDTLDVTFDGIPTKVMNGYKNTIEMYATGVVDEFGRNYTLDSVMKLTSSSDTFNVRFNNPPVITGTDKVFYQGQYTSKYWVDTLRWKDMKATDVEDGNITSKVKIIYDNVNVNVPNVYKVIYSVTDNFGKSATKEIKVTVKYNNPPVITGKDKTFYQGQYTSKYWVDTLRWKDMKATDVEDGNITSKVKVTYDNVDVNVPNVYKFVYSVTDSFGKSTSKEIKVTVKYNTPPIISGEDRWFYVDEDVTNVRLMERVKANDIEDGNITSKAKIKSSNVQSGVVGDYKVTYKVTDAFGKSAETTVSIFIRGHDPVTDKQNITYIRHISKNYLDTLHPRSIWRTNPEMNALLVDALNRNGDDQAISIWKFTNEEIELIQQQNDEYGLGEDANKKFLETFGGNKIK